MTIKAIRMPLQPIRRGHFVPNRIVEHFLRLGGVELFKGSGCLDGGIYTNEEKMQVLQLLGCSVEAFALSSYTDAETAMTAQIVAEKGTTETHARLTVLRNEIAAMQSGGAQAMGALSDFFEVLPE